MCKEPFVVRDKKINQPTNGFERTKLAPRSDTEENRGASAIADCIVPPMAVWRGPLDHPCVYAVIRAHLANDNSFGVLWCNAAA